MGAEGTTVSAKGETVSAKAAPNFWDLVGTASPTADWTMKFTSAPTKIYTVAPTMDWASGFTAAPTQVRKISLDCCADLRACGVVEGGVQCTVLTTLYRLSGRE